MKKKLKYTMYALLYFFFLLIFEYCLFNFDKVISLVTGLYPAVGDYYISFDYDESKNVIANVFYVQDIYEERINLSNLKLYIKPSSRYHMDRDDIYNDNKIRKMLLESGLAKIIDEDIASDEEISYQKKAIYKGNGVWNSIKDSKSSISLHMIFDKIFLFLKSNIGKFLKWIIFTGIGVSSIYYFIKRKISAHKIDTILMGGISSGKTTILNRMQMPNITEGMLLEEATSTKTQQVVKCDRIAYKNKDIYPYLFDNRGDDYGKMIDAVNKFGINKSDNKIIIYVISFTQSNSSSEFDYSFANSQISKAAVLVKSFKTSRSMKKVNKIFIFFNKCDLLYSSESDFIRNKGKIKSMYNYLTDYHELEEYADHIFYGSALKGWGIEELKRAIIRADEMG